MKKLLIGMVSLLGGCVSLPDNAAPVTGFEPERYLGTWYEIARLDHRFERGLSRVTATYTSRDDGGINVVNRGYRDAEGEWSQASGRAYPVGARDVGFLKVSFFRPFYGAYVIFDLEPDYSRAFVTTDGEKYLWFLSRTPGVSQAEKDRFIEATRGLGIDPAALIWVPQQGN